VISNFVGAGASKKAGNSVDQFQKSNLKPDKSTAASRDARKTENRQTRENNTKVAKATGSAAAGKAVGLAQSLALQHNLLKIVSKVQMKMGLLILKVIKSQKMVVNTSMW